VINIECAAFGKVVDLLNWKDKIPLPAREESVSDSEEAGAMVSMS
jgi:hypothetical protein